MTDDELLQALETDACDLAIPAHTRSTIGAAASAFHRHLAHIGDLEQQLRNERHDHNNTRQRLAFSLQREDADKRVYR